VVQPGPSAAAAPQDALVSVAERVGPAVVSVRSEQGLGSGVIYDGGGLVLTNAHVVNGAREISVGLADGRRFSGRVLGADRGFDLAVGQIGGQGLPVAPLGDSASLRVGQFVAAIGNPYGFDHTVTTGVVSALNRPIAEGQESYAQPMIQTDAAINPGNSGGPLLDLQGEVVGITTLVAAPDGFPAQGLGFAVPVDTAKRIAPQLATGGQISRSGQPYLGVSIGDNGDPTERPSPYQTRPRGPAGADHGAQLVRVDPNGSAVRAGLRAGDVVSSFDGRDVYTADDFLQVLVLHQPGDQIQLDVMRGDQRLNVTVEVGEAPPR